DVAVDGNGDLFMSMASGSDKVVMMPAGSSTPLLLGSGFSDARGIAVDSKGYVYVADNGSHSIKMLRPTGGYFCDTSLPDGIILNPKNGVISGTALAATASENCKVTAYN